MFDSQVDEVTGRCSCITAASYFTLNTNFLKNVQDPSKGNPLSFRMLCSSFRRSGLSCSPFTGKLCFYSVDKN